MLHAIFSAPTIGSPINFQGDDSLRLQEYTISSMPSLMKSRFIEFCYCSDLPNRDREIEIDEKLYWRDAALFLVTDANETIVGCAMFIKKTCGTKLPIEFSRIAKPHQIGDVLFDAHRDAGTDSVTEIYRLRRAFTISRSQVKAVINMLFKAIWAKVIQTDTDFLYCTCDQDVRELEALYEKRLAFLDTGIKVTYPGITKLWNVYRKDCMKHEVCFASLSPRHFELQNYVRSNLKQMVHHKVKYAMLGVALQVRSMAANN